MAVSVQCDSFPLGESEVAGLWREVLRQTGWGDGVVTVRCVSKQEMQRLNRRYRGKDKVTDVLTFSYGEEHDIALCLEAARQEAGWGGRKLKDYAAWLLAHAFLHVTGMDHEGTSEEADRMEKLEGAILKKKGF